MIACGVSYQMSYEVLRYHVVHTAGALYSWDYCFGLVLARGVRYRPKRCARDKFININTMSQSFKAVDVIIFYWRKAITKKI